MELKCEDKRLEALRLQYQKRKQPTDKEVIEDLTEFDEEDPCQDNFQDSFLIEPFERKEEWHSAKFNADGHLAVQKNQDEGYDLLRDRVDKVIIDSFSLKKEIRHCKFDSNGNFIPLDEYDEEEEEEEECDEEIENLIDFDPQMALSFLRFLISYMDHDEDVCQTFRKFKDDEQQIADLTTAASQLQFMGLENIYGMKRGELGRKYNQLMKETQNY
ncbi:hypothetical protein M9Y10_002105 [Tritrichomonas musculus]|uniref:Uncharacterized protein n=1 Tax=Tritrichomonas musculus TaxID=1915356 RepID=A0ABR2L8V0_9EUKA